MPRRSR